MHGINGHETDWDPMVRRVHAFHPEQTTIVLPLYCGRDSFESIFKQLVTIKNYLLHSNVTQVVASLRQIVTLFFGFSDILAFFLLR